MSGRLWGVGIGHIIIAFLMIIYFNVIIGWALVRSSQYPNEVSKNLSVVGELLPVVVLILHHLLDVAFFVSSTCLFVMSSRLRGRRRSHHHDVRGEGGRDLQQLHEVERLETESEKRLRRYRLVSRSWNSCLRV